MATVHVLTVSPSCGTPPQSPAFHIDTPRRGDTIPGYALDIAGWVCDPKDAVTAVEVHTPDRDAIRAPTEVHRPDVAAVLGVPGTDRCGFALRLDLLGLPLSDGARLYGIRRHGSPIPLAEILWRRTAVRSAFRPRIQPLLVTSMGRMGTTWLMQLLSALPGVVTHRRYPFETQPCRHWMQLFLRLTGHPAELPPPNTDWMQADPRLRFGAELTALRRWFSTDYVEQALTFCQASVEAFYERLALDHGIRKPTYFAEKAGSKPFTRLVREAYPEARELFLVRDFRDTFCSMQAFNAKRGYVSFQREAASSTEDHLAVLGRDAARLARHWRERQDSALLVRYEDLVREPVTTLRAIAQYLGLALSPGGCESAVRAASAQELEFHRTSASPSASIGRWRAALEPTLAERCHVAFAEALAAFGYDAAA